jgi:transmembrane protein 132
LASSPLELSEFLWVDFLVENGTSGGVAVTRPVTWQLEYPGQAPEAEKDKMVWEILVSERDIRALVPLAKVRGPQLFPARLGAKRWRAWG